MNDKIQEYKKDKEALVKELLASGAKPGSGAMWHCCFHNDKSPSSRIKKTATGNWVFQCFVCDLWNDALGLEALRTGKSFGELVKEKFGEIEQPKRQYYYPTLDALVESLGDVRIDEINTYTNPDTNNIDLVTLRYIPRDSNKKCFSQAHETPKGFINKRPSGALPLFNRIRVREADTILFVEGESVVRELATLGIVATTGSGGAANGDSHDYSPLKGKKAILWADNDEPGKRFMELVRSKLLELDPVPSVFEIDISTLDLTEGDDAVDVCAKIKAEGGNRQDCIDCITCLIDEAEEVNELDCVESLLEDMREGRYINLPISDFPILTNEARMLLNKRIGIIYGNAGFGKTLFLGKMCDDLLLSGKKVVRLQLEDEKEQHILRSFAQQSARGELVNDDYHREHPLESKVLYEQFKPTLNTISKSIVAGEHEDWNLDKLLAWEETQFKQGAEVVAVDPVSALMDGKIWILSHRLMWGSKKLLAKYPNGRIVYVSHPNAEGQVAGGQALKRFSHAMLMLNRYAKPKKVEIIDRYGNITENIVEASIDIVKSRYGRGQGLSIAVMIEPSTMSLVELGIIVKEVEKPRNPVGRQIDNDDSNINL